MSTLEIYPGEHNSSFEATFFAHMSGSAEPQAYITLYMSSDATRTTHLQGIASSVEDQGIGTKLLLIGMEWAQKNGAIYLDGTLITEQSYEKIQLWYKKRGINIMDEGYLLEANVSGVIAACQGILTTRDQP